MHSVPKGSVLGTLLFLLYVNDLTKNVPGTKLVLSANDISLLITAKDEFDLQHKIINAMKELEIWFQKNNLIIYIKNHLLCHFIQNKSEFCQDHE
jgi:hypothetical protein